MVVWMQKMFLVYQDGREVKALDLRSNGRLSSWVRTPLLVEVWRLSHLHPIIHLNHILLTIIKAYPYLWVCLRGHTLTHTHTVGLLQLTIIVAYPLLCVCLLVKMSVTLKKLTLFRFVIIA